MNGLKDEFLVATVDPAVLSLEHSLLELSKHYRSMFIISFNYVRYIIREFELGAIRKPSV